METPKIFTAEYEVPTFIFKDFEQHLDFQADFCFMNIDSFIECDEQNQRNHFIPKNNNWSDTFLFIGAEVIIDNELKREIIFSNNEKAIRLYKAEV